MNSSEEPVKQTRTRKPKAEGAPKKTRAPRVPRQPKPEPVPQPTAEYVPVPRDVLDNLVRCFANDRVDAAELDAYEKAKALLEVEPQQGVPPQSQASELSNWRYFMATAPLKIVDMGLMLYRRLTQQPPPISETALGVDQWTVMYDDENNAIKFVCEQGGVTKQRLDAKKLDSENKRAVALRNLKAASEAYNSEGDPRQKELFRQKVESLKTLIQQMEAEIEQAEGCEAPVVEFSFPLGEIA